MGARKPSKNDQFDGENGALSRSFATEKTETYRAYLPVGVVAIFWRFWTERHYENGIWLFLWLWRKQVVIKPIAEYILSDPVTVVLFHSAPVTDTPLSR